MTLSAKIARQFREVYFGGNWTSVNLKQTLADVSWEQAASRVYDFNSIAALVYHIHYYVLAISRVLEGGPLDAKDRFSFDHPVVSSREAWEQSLATRWLEAEHFADLIERLPDSRLNEVFADEKYGSYYRNLAGVIEHTHYHLGQIVLIKKLLAWQTSR